MILTLPLGQLTMTAAEEFVYCHPAVIRGWYYVQDKTVLFIEQAWWPA